MEQLNSQQNYFKPLTGLRIIAAYMVFCHHYDVINTDIFGKTIHDFFREFHVGVTLFFVLSGFLITHRYYQQPKINLKKYVLNRFARLYPMYFLLTTFSFVVFGIIKQQSTFNSISIFLLNISFFRGFFDAYKFSGIAQGWSLTVEEVFYIIAPLCFVIIKRNKVFLLILPLFTIVLGFILVFIFQNSTFYTFMNSVNFMLDFTFFGRCFEFFIGMALAVYIDKISFKAKFTTYFGFIFVILLIFLLSVIKVDEVSYGTDTVFGKIINTLVLPLVGIAPLLYGLIKEKTLISRILSTTLFQVLGKSSYIFYLIHLGIFATIIQKISSNVALLFFVLNSISVLLYYTMELPLNNWLKRCCNAQQKV